MELSTAGSFLAHTYLTRLLGVCLGGLVWPAIYSGYLRAGNLDISFVGKHGKACIYSLDYWHQVSWSELKWFEKMDRSHGDCGAKTNDMELYIYMFSVNRPATVPPVAEIEILCQSSEYQSGKLSSVRAAHFNSMDMLGGNDGSRGDGAANVALPVQNTVYTANTFLLLKLCFLCNTQCKCPSWNLSLTLRLEHLVH